MGKKKKGPSLLILALKRNIRAKMPGLQVNLQGPEILSHPVTLLKGHLRDAVEGSFRVRRFASYFSFNPINLTVNINPNDETFEFEIPVASIPIFPVKLNSTAEVDEERQYTVLLRSNQQILRWSVIFRNQQDMQIFLQNFQEMLDVLQDVAVTTGTGSSGDSSESSIRSGDSDSSKENEEL
jgi:hypothetical protein